MKAYTRAMKQVTVILPDALERKLKAYLKTHAESADDVVQTSLEVFTDSQIILTHTSNYPANCWALR